MSKLLSPRRLAYILPAEGPLVLSVGERREILDHMTELEAKLAEAEKLAAGHEQTSEMRLRRAEAAEARCRDLTHRLDQETMRAEAAETQTRMSAQRIKDLELTGSALRNRIEEMKG